MKLREIRIKNFRCLVDVTVPITDTTVLVGENNSGKTALLDALRIALTRRPGGRTPLFDEYDYHMAQANDSPQTSEGIAIELWFREDSSDEWPDSLIQVLSEIIQTDPVEDLDSIGLRLTSKFDSTANEMVSLFEFLSVDGQPLGGRSKDPRNLARFRDYILSSYLSPLRDSESAFSPRSQFWGPILRDLQISEEQRSALSDELVKLNAALLEGDPRLKEVLSTLNEVQEVMGLGSGQRTSIQALPLKPWDLMSKSEVVIKARGSDIEFPLACHGQGMQSLAVLFLFQAFVEVLLKPTYKSETEAILVFEEPEAHLHPHATRALASKIDKLGSQRIVSSHSPYFIQEIPFTQIRLFRRDGSSSKVLYIKQSFSAIVPTSKELSEFCRRNATKFDYQDDSSTLTVKGKIEETEYRELLTIYKDQREVHSDLRRLKDESQLYLSADELSDLETYAKRIRGEVLFARAWLLCEGQSEYLLFRYFSNLLDRPLDNAGVTVIDFKNNGSAGAFVGLARAFEIPWLMVCDNDDAGNSYIEEVRSHGLTDEEIGRNVRLLPGDGIDLEMFLVRNGFANEYLEILAEQSVSLNKKEGEEGFEEEIRERISSDKIGYTIALIEKLREKKADESKIPNFFQQIINDVIEKAI
ncbi:MAG: AAA family ATPase [bacterium]|nr:AAA family ATPase [bacterium]